MATVNLTDTQLEELIKKAVASTLSERSDLLERGNGDALYICRFGLKGWLHAKFIYVSTCIGIGS